MLKKNNFDSNRTYIVKILLSVFFIVMVLCPLVKMLTYLFQADVGKIVQSKQFVLALKNSLFSTLISTIISVVLAYMLALCVYRTQNQFCEEDKCHMPYRALEHFNFKLEISILLLLILKNKSSM